MFYNLTTDKWSPALQIRTVLLSIQALLSAPNPDDPLANDVAELWKIDEEKAIKNGMFIIQLNNRHFINPLTPMAFVPLLMSSPLTQLASSIIKFAAW